MRYDFRLIQVQKTRSSARSLEGWSRARWTGYDTLPRIGQPAILIYWIVGARK